MKEPRKDDEQLSALLEGRVQGPQREELLAHLSTSGDDYEVFTDTAAVLRALEEEDARAAGPRKSAVLPFRRGGRGWGTRARRLALAAAAAAVVVTSALVLRPRGTAADTPLRLAARVEAPAAGLDAWASDRPWATRGDEARSRARAAQAGALLVDLSLAVRTGDSAATARFAVQLHDRADGRAGPDAPLPRIAARAGAPAESLQPLLNEAGERIASRLPREWVELGAWTEAARLAAAGRDETFFRGDDTPAMLSRAGTLTRGDADAQAALVQVRAALEGAPEWAPLAEGLYALLGAIAS